VIKTLSITSGNPYPTRLCTNPAGDSIYILHQTLSAISINSTEINSSLSISGNHLFYNLTCDAITGHLFLSDAVDFVQNGIVFRLNRDGSKVDSMMAGLIPGELIFNK
jgi:hypothetical protein